jgi:Cys-tRNA(Pro)/Cys-tRNA(Cys) deacylase
VAGRGTAATALLEREGIPHTVHTYAHDPQHESYGSEASEALSVPARRVLKTLVASVDGVLTVGVVPSATRVTAAECPRRESNLLRPF